MHLLLIALLFCGNALIGAQTTHWAYAPLQRPNLPAGVASQNPIDSVVRAKLHQAGIAPSPPADPRTLLRRVYLNLTGLPPSAADLESFLESPSDLAYRERIDQLLASQRYGERWARHWLDTVHFAETHGHDQDRIRTNAWPYRDYVIASFNSDKPYARFVEEQVAGDVLFPDDPQATVALGFLAAGPWDESSLRDIREETLDRQIARYLDRDDMISTVMQTVNSSTVQCARCHDHKFDPISAKEYYSMQAVFSAMDRANRTYDSDPTVHARRAKLLAQQKRIVAQDEAWLMAEAQQALVEQWIRKNRETVVQWQDLDLQSWTSASGSILSVSNSIVTASGHRPERDTYTISFSTSLHRITALKLELIASPDLPMGGPGRNDNGNLHLTEFELLAFGGNEGQGKWISFSTPAADFNQDGWTIQHAMDGNEKTAWGIFPAVGKSHQALFPLREPLQITENLRLVVQLKQLHGGGHLIGKFKLSVTANEVDAGSVLLPGEIANIVAKSREEHTAQERVQLSSFVLLREVEDELGKLPAAQLVYAAATEFSPDGGLKPAGKPRPVHMLRRGEITRLGEEVAPGALSFILPLNASFGLDMGSPDADRRRSLARWLTSNDNVLTWRSIVNRVWHYHFGRGLVDTPNDFGKMGSVPSHPELLDWLAVWFRDEAKGSLKELHRLIMTSDTYQQSSQSTSGLEADPENKLLWRMNPGRLDAEQVRDSILQIAGALDLRMGGPSDIQFDLQPGHHVTPKVDYTKYDVTQEKTGRRSIYRFLFRTLPDPFMDALDCPAGDQLAPVRTTSVTVQQALALWNNAFIAHYAAIAATRFSKSEKSPEQVEAAYREILGRGPTQDEMQQSLEYTQKHGLANLCRVMFNLNEFMFVN